jgi:hypothetical protein
MGDDSYEDAVAQAALLKATQERCQQLERDFTVRSIACASSDRFTSSVVTSSPQHAHKRFALLRHVRPVDIFWESWTCGQQQGASFSCASQFDNLKILTHSLAWTGSVCMPFSLEILEACVCNAADVVRERAVECATNRPAAPDVSKPHSTPQPVGGRRVAERD